MTNPPRHQSQTNIGSNTHAIEYWPIAKLKPPAQLARKHPAEQIEKLKNSFQKFGFLGVILIDESGEIIVGSARFEAAKQLGYDELPVIVINHLTEAEIKAYRLADNKLAELSSWDEEVLRAEFESILSIDIDFELEVTGFETAEIDFLLSDDGDSEDDPDDALPDSVDTPAVSRPGDLWIVGDHHLLCGDAKVSSDYERLLAGHAPIVVIIDPPWNVPINGHVGNSGKTQHREFIEASGEMSDREFANFLDVVVQQIADNVANGGLIFGYIDWRGLEKMLAAGYQPISGYLIAPHIYETLRDGSGVLQSGQTHVNHPFACAIALEVQKTIEEDNMLEAVNRQGARFRAGLQRLADYNPYIGDVRGRGLFLGIEFVSDKETKKPMPNGALLAAQLKATGIEHNLLIYPGSGTADGKEGCHILFGPPFIATDSEIDEMLYRIENVIKHTIPTM